MDKITDREFYIIQLNNKELLICETNAKNIF
jgi:hypothetical protein